MKIKINFKPKISYSKILLPETLYYQANNDEFLKDFVPKPNTEVNGIFYNDILVGFFKPRKTIDYDRVGPIYIIPEYRNKGIAKEILTQFIKTNEKSLAFIDYDNKASFELFKSLNFKVVEDDKKLKGYWVAYTN